MPKTKTINNEELFAGVEDIIGEGGNIQIRVKGGSMRPFLRDGRDSVSLAPVDRAALRRGMVVLFRHNGRHILHRIRRLEGNTLVIKGDGNYRIAERSTRGQVAAYVEKMERGSRVIPYRSARWRMLTLVSLSTKIIRTLYYDLIKSVKSVWRRK